jgi:hypothetical protein
MCGWRRGVEANRGRVEASVEASVELSLGCQACRDCQALSGPVGPCRAPVGLTLLTTVKQLSGTVGHVGAKVGCDHACVLSGTVGLSGCRAVGHVGACRGMSGHVGHVKAVGLSMWTSVCVLCSL